jgi:hypothetical protein
MIAGNGGRHSIDEPGHGADERRANRREYDQSDRQGRADGARADVEGGEACGHAREEWELEHYARAARIAVTGKPD